MTFVAILELLKDRVIDIVQSEIYAPIYVKPADQVVEGQEIEDEGADVGI